jgi:GNAT superfamily N-acetyltransferase
MELIDMKVILRPATHHDAAALASIHVLSRRVAMPWLPVVHDELEVTGYLRDEILRRCSVQVAEAPGEGGPGALLGYVAVDVAAGELENLYLLDHARRRGIGSALLSWAKTVQPGGLRLWVFQRNLAARAFYEARGFVLEHLTDGQANEEREPEARYRWP